MKQHALLAISPIDGRYASKCENLSSYFSEFGLMKYRVRVECEYFLALVEIPLPQLKKVSIKQKEQVKGIADNFYVSNAERIKEIEATTNHDVKAVEYFLKEEFRKIGLEKYEEFIHFGLTSQDINNTALPLSLKEGLTNEYLPSLQEVLRRLNQLAKEWQNVAMLARTHGQPASPTRLGKEIGVFTERVTQQLQLLKTIPHAGKFGGATGNFNAHAVAYTDIDWSEFANRFLSDKLGLVRSHPTTQIEHYDHLAAHCDNFKRINNILIDFCRDVWTYISLEYFGQKTIKDEVGSSAMPHKVNPIDFENAEGNLGVANALLEHFAAKLPISRLQRDLTDSTVTRNMGVPIAHMMIANQSILKGLNKLVLQEVNIETDLKQNWMVIAEGIQTILRREGYPKPYETLKDLTRENQQITRKELHAFIDNLRIAKPIKEELKEITPLNYTGI